MTNTNLEVKQVPFMGAELMAARDNDGQIWVGVRWVCEGVGLSQGQTKAERARIQNDNVLSKGGRNFVLPTKGGNQETLCLKLDFVPLWLAKINVTPKMAKENPEVAERLIQYQLRAKDVLAAAFLQKQKERSPEELLANPEAIIYIATQWKEEKERREKLEAQVKRDAPSVLFARSVKASDDTILIGGLAKFLRQNGVQIGQNRLFEWLRENGYLIKRHGSEWNMPTQYAMELGLFKVQERTIMCPNKKPRITRTVRVTGKGQEYFLNLFLREKTGETALAVNQ